MVGSMTSVLDEAYERMAQTDFELPNGFVNHGPMACEALVALGRDDQVDGWARWFTNAVGAGPSAVGPNPRSPFDWRDALGAYQRLPEWLGFYQELLDNSTWTSVVEVWVPRLMPGLASALFHGAIHTAHAVRAVSAADTEPRRAELARSLAYWSARFRPGQDLGADEEFADVRDDLIESAAEGASRYATRRSILDLHGVTGAMAVDILLDHISPAAATDALHQLRAEHAAMYLGVTASVPEETLVWNDDWIDASAHSGDAHQVKLVEACRRAFEVSGDRRFILAAEVVSR
jgi:hypothetical protein